MKRRHRGAVSPAELLIEASQEAARSSSGKRCEHISICMSVKRETGEYERKGERKRTYQNEAGGVGPAATGCAPRDERVPKEERKGEKYGTNQTRRCTNEKKKNGHTHTHTHTTETRQNVAWRAQQKSCFSSCCRCCRCCS